MREGDELKSLKRGLRCLYLLNHRNTISVAVAARELDLPRTTAERILNTLVTEGYVLRGRRDKLYRLTRKVQALSNGYNDASLLHAVAAPLLYEATAEIGWPLEIAGARGENVVALVATDDATALKIGRRSVGFEFPMIQCSAGLVYLAFLKPVEREALLGLLVKTKEFKKYWGGDLRRLSVAVDATRQRGYALGFETGVSETAMSVPILVDGSIKAILAMVYMTKAMTDAQVVKNLLPRISALADEVARRVCAEQALQMPVAGPAHDVWSIEFNGVARQSDRNELRVAI